MPELVFRLERSQLARLRIYAVAGLALLVITILVAELTGWGWPLAPLFGIAGLGFGTTFLSQRNAFTRIDAAGIDANIGLGLRRSAGWADVADIQPRLRGHDWTVRVTRTSGRPFTLGAPIRSAILPDDGFEAKVGQILDAWEQSLAE